MFQTVPGGLGKWENMPSGKIPPSLITWEKSEKAEPGEEGGQMGRWNSLCSAHLAMVAAESGPLCPSCTFPRPASDCS